LTDEPLSIAVRPVESFRTLEPVWTDLEGRSNGSFFQSWAWTGCLGDERFAEPWLLSARCRDTTVALGLFNRAPRHPLRLDRPLYLAESGVPALDTIFIEYNGLLLDRAAPAGVAGQCWAALADGAFKGARWVLGGVLPTVSAALPANRAVRVRTQRPVSFHELFAFAETPIVDRLSANARQQLRRALRGWEKIGPLTLEIAGSREEALTFLNGLKTLHQRYWTGRGKPGAFAAPFFERFHRELIGRPGPGQSVDLIRVTAGSHVVGYLYNFVHRGWVAAYQSGFDFGLDADRLKPGLVCHLLAMEHYRQAGMQAYDFLGGEARYKRTFANAETELLWLEVRHKSPWLFGRRRASSAPQTMQAG
jgi:CelD/BcsL family acetyltransferase involved in cellulose biosynthesis